jgi:hypothetical protein
MSRQRLFTLIALIVIFPLGFFTKFYSGPGHSWFNDSLGGLLYEIFWCLVAFFLLPRAKPIVISLWVLAITCALEFLQLWHPPFLELMRSNFIGRTIIGNSFNPMDFPYYFAGSALGFFILKGLKAIGIRGET